jgi:hypothetical protein
MYVRGSTEESLHGQRVEDWKRGRERAQEMTQGTRNHQRKEYF